MRKLSRLAFAIAICMLALRWTAPVAADFGVYRYHFADPPAIFGDGQDRFTLEVATNDRTIRRVSLTANFPGFGPLYDDGTHGDRVAADGIWTLSGLSLTMPDWVYSFDGTHGRYGLSVRIDKGDGTQETHGEPWIALAHPAQRYPAIQLAPNLFATRYAFFIVDPSGETLDSKIPLGNVQCGKTAFAAFHKLYSVFPDAFDFVAVMPSGAIFDPSRQYGENVPYFVRAKNEIRNIGVPLFDNTARFGSKGRLRGMIYHSAGDGQILDHEIGHSWMASFGKRYDLAECAQCYGDHFNSYTDIGGQMSAYLTGYRTSHLAANGDGTFRVFEEDGSRELYSKLGLYLMGLVPPSDVPPVNKLTNPNFSNAARVTAERVETYTIQQLMQAEGGERVPSYPNTQREFTVAFVVVNNKPFTPAEFSFYSNVARYFASREKGNQYLTTFYTATEGRAALTSELPEVPIGSPSPAVVNAASFAGGAVAPGELISVFGYELGTAAPARAALDGQGRVAPVAGETQVFFDGAAAPMIYAQSGQLSTIVPYRVSGKTATRMQILSRGLASVTLTLPVAQSAPGIFTRDASGRGPALAVNQTGQINSASAPADRGSVVVFYVTGEGQTTPAGIDGQPAGNPLPKPLAQVSVTIGGVSAEVSYAGGAPGLVAGVMQVNAVVPRNALAGDAVPIEIAAGAARSPAGVTLSIR